jgi:hypothetical protein
MRKVIVFGNKLDLAETAKIEGRGRGREKGGSNTAKEVRSPVEGIWGRGPENGGARAGNRQCATF